MAVVIESKSTTAWAAADSLVITKPTGLAEGELLVAHVGITKDGAGPGTYTTPANWTQIVADSQSDGNKSVAHYVFIKTADAADAAATDFTFDHTDSRWVAGALFRISGHGGLSSVQYNQAETSNTTSPTFANTVTPAFANSLLLFLVAHVDAEQSATVSTYAITTSNPTWSEEYDMYGDADALYGAATNGDGTLAAASATRAAITATGDSSCSISAASGGSFTEGAIVVIPPVVNVTVSPSVISIPSSVVDPVVTAGATVAVASALSLTSNIIAPTVTTAVASITNQTKIAAVNIDNATKT